MTYNCKECDKVFSTKKGLHLHISKSHNKTVAEYYKEHLNRRDLYSGRPIKFKNSEQYENAHFNTYDNFRKWLESAENSEGRRVVVEEFLFRKRQKNMGFIPSESYLYLSKLATRQMIESIMTYEEFSEAVGVEQFYNNELYDGFWEEDPDVHVLVDTREQKPFKFDNMDKSKLDFGDYTLSGEHYDKTFIERKSASDFLSTFSNGFERLNREIERCKEFNSFLFIVVESTIPKLQQQAVFKNYGNRLRYVFHNARKLLLKYPEHVQIIFAGNKTIAQRFTKKLLIGGQRIWRVDMQYELDKKLEESTNGVGKRHSERSTPVLC